MMVAGYGIRKGRTSFSITTIWGKNGHFWAKKTPEHIQNGQTKGNGGYTARAAPKIPKCPVDPKIPKWTVLGPKMGQKWVKNASFQTSS